MQFEGRIGPWAALAAGLMALVVFWHDGVADLFRVWSHSTTYGHGMLVLPASVTLIALGWRSDERVSVWGLALLGVVPAAMLYWVGHHWDIRLFQHTAITMGLISLITGTLGKPFSERHRFAIGFLLFMIPAGDILIPFLQNITARGVMVGCHLFDVPAIREETMIRTDAGDFEIERGCAGLRYQIAAIMVGVLGAHLFFITRWKQALYVVAALTIPVLTNIVRASTVVIVATWTDMHHLTGFSHVVYGWGLFAIVMAIIIALGLFTSERDAPMRPEPPIAPQNRTNLLYIGATIGAIAIAGIG
ncbi:MAG: exosortase A [Parvularcula sp.]